MERAVSFLIPAPCREEVMGDLYESCGSRTRFLASAIRFKRWSSRILALVKVLFTVLALAWAGRQLSGNKAPLLVSVIGIAVIVFREITKT
jgi:hypothetical protein